MPLSEYEQRVLEQMERQLTSDDPRLANTLQSTGHRTVGRWVLAGSGFVVGMLVLVAGAAGSRLWLGVIGFLLMFAACVFAFAAPRATGPTGVVNAKGGVTPRAGAAAKKSGGGLLRKFEQRWDRRRDQDGH
ncbi:DUF3040 domain-containing protein [Pengzhenrongella sicca]|uniref:DUF3040 domain-containing protein n=1 Tax=Pengzhenrongella sicca TaxID=2819238 RepID=A0A8A4ZM59_9MICO|nr:DUF3040 domain-containing protein [Pengzhenrongella sicca]QTE30648.1 DUF3040 domain-containing protein [Pengzhenrongella sicca]